MGGTSPGYKTPWMSAPGRATQEGCAATTGGSGHEVPHVNGAWRQYRRAKQQRPQQADGS